MRERDKQKLFEGACKIAVEDGKFLMSWIGMLDEVTGSVEPAARAGVFEGYLEHLLHITIFDTPEGHGPTGTALRENRTVVCNDIEHDESMIPWRDRALAIGYKSSVAFPLHLTSKIIGTMNFYSNELHFFNKDEIHLLEELAADISFALESLAQEEQRKQMEAALQESERKFREAVINLDEGYYSVTPGGVLLEHNRGFNCIFGFDKSADLKGSYLPDFWQNPDERKAYLRELNAHGSISNYQINAKKNTGEKITILASAHLILETDNRPMRIEGILLDITERKQAEEEIRRLNAELEERVLQRTAELESANKELEAFSYSVSHDLRAPLRHVGGYVELLAKQFQENLPEKGRHYLDAITDSVQLMGILIDDLLNFSRSGRTEMRLSTFGMNQVVAEVSEQIRQYNSGRNIKLSITRLPSVHCDYAMMRLVWENLLSNAVKFTRTREAAKIDIGFREEGSEFVFFVRDNGVGFDMRYAQKLFGVFQRFHSASEFEGTGVGLANVRRIIMRHGGRTWAEAELEDVSAGKPGGATFYFTLPK